MLTPAVIATATILAVGGLFGAVVWRIVNLPDCETDVEAVIPHDGTEGAR